MCDECIREKNVKMNYHAVFLVKKGADKNIPVSYMFH